MQKKLEAIILVFSALPCAALRPTVHFPPCRHFYSTVLFPILENVSLWEEGNSYYVQLALSQKITVDWFSTTGLAFNLHELSR